MYHSQCITNYMCLSSCHPVSVGLCLCICYHSQCITNYMCLSSCHPVSAGLCLCICYHSQCITNYMCLSSCHPVSAGLCLCICLCIYLDLSVCDFRQNLVYFPLVLWAIRLKIPLSSSMKSTNASDFFTCMYCLMCVSEYLAETQLQPRSSKAVI